MIKFSIKTIIFSTIVFLLVLCSGKLFLNKSNVQSFRNEQYKMLKGDFDIGFFGSSHVFCSYDPRVFESELQLSAYNYGVAAQNLNTTLAIVKQEIKKRNLKLGIVDIFWETLREPPFSNRISSFQLQSIDYMDFSFEKIQLFNKIFGKDSLLNIFPTLRDHALWKDRVFQSNYYLKTDIDYYKGFKPPLYFNNNVWKNLVNDKKIDNESNEINSKYQLSIGEKQVIDDVIETFKSLNVPLLFVSAPIHKKYISNKDFNYQNLIKVYLKQKGADFLDLNDYWDNLSLHLFDFKDDTHLNTNGALKVSQYLATYIKKNYNITTNSSIDLSKNRYALLENPQKNGAILYNKIENPKIKKQTGVEKLILYKDRYGRLEILLVGDSLKDITIEVAYDVATNKKRQLDNEVQRNIKKDRFSVKEKFENLKNESLYNGYNYKGSEFKVVIVDCPFAEIRNLSIAIGDKAPKEIVVNKKYLKLN